MTDKCRSRVIRVAIGQMPCVIADVDANFQTMTTLAHQARDQGADMIVFPELALTGYLVGNRFSDVSLLRDSPGMKRLRDLSKAITLVTGFIEESPDARFFNSAVCLHDGQILHVHRKVYPPNYGIFDERRYFGAGRIISAFDTPYGRMAMLICGDCWHMSLPYLAAHDGADILLMLVASSEEGLAPNISSRQSWERLNQSYALTLSCFVVFANRAGTEGDLHFWGGSHFVLPDGNMLQQAQIGTPDLIVGDIDLDHVRRARVILPFRRDDNLEFTIRLSQKILNAADHRAEASTHRPAAPPVRLHQPESCPACNKADKPADDLPKAS